MKRTQGTVAVLSEVTVATGNDLVSTWGNVNRQ